MKPSVTGYRILVDPAPIENEWDSSIVGLVKHETTVDVEKRNTAEGTVLQVGQDCYKKDSCAEPWCKVGDRVLINIGSGSAYYDKDDNDKLYLIVNEEDVKATLS